MKQGGRWTALCRIVLGCTFALSGFTKVIDPWGTALKVNEYLSIYGFERLERFSMGFSIWLCGAELMMGCMLLFKVRIRLVSIFVFASMIFFTALTFLSATWIPVEDCGCFGEALKLTPLQTFLKNLLLLPLSWVVWRYYRTERIFAFTRSEAVLTCLFFLFSMGLGVGCYRHLPLIDFLPYRIGLDLRHARLNPAADNLAPQIETVLVYRERQTGQLHEFALEDTAWQDDERWEWVETRTEGELPPVQPLIGEFTLRSSRGDITREILSEPGRVYLLCAARPDRLSADCARRFASVVRRAAVEGARAICITPSPLDESHALRFAGATVEASNIDATTLKTLLRADAGVVVIDDGVIVAKRNCRDIEP